MSIEEWVRPCHFLGTIAKGPNTATRVYKTGCRISSEDNVFSVCIFLTGSIVTVSF